MSDSSWYGSNDDWPGQPASSIFQRLNEDDEDDREEDVYAKYGNSPSGSGGSSSDSGSDDSSSMNSNRGDSDSDGDDDSSSDHDSQSNSSDSGDHSYFQRSIENLILSDNDESLQEAELVLRSERIIRRKMDTIGDDLKNVTSELGELGSYDYSQDYYELTFYAQTKPQEIQEISNIPGTSSTYYYESSGEKPSEDYKATSSQQPEQQTSDADDSKEETRQHRYMKKRRKPGT
ncbi:hypothetical protein H4219_003976 [Mycoemilia scoparia]|uniref:Uncharacterized protein n=1 Tax=Mycoemilia scoparia TaxID=417184 RepID=A0A9W7ZU12_9FUNG|nr:hypothetical protein H4219_003976 [Mycoemilia scoparia]